MDLKRWVEKNSPPADFILSLPEEYDGMEEEAVPIIKEHWPKVRDFISEQNKISGTKTSIFDYKMPWPEYEQFRDTFDGRSEYNYIKDSMECEFANFVQDIPMIFSNAGLHQESIDFSYELLDLFAWDDSQRDQILGDIGSSMWAIDPVKGEDFFKHKLTEAGHSEPLAASYTFELMIRERWEDAAEVLKDYKNSTDPTMIDRFRWLKERE